MTQTQLLIIIAAIYAAPHIPRWFSLPFAAGFCCVGLALEIMK